MHHLFKIGDRVQAIGLLPDFYAGQTGTVVAVNAVFIADERHEVG